MITTTFSILDHLDKLTPAKGKNRYLCEVCGKNNFTLDPKTGEYQCWDGCSVADIRNAVAPLPKKSPRPQQQRDWGYYDKDGNPLIQVCRSDNGKGDKDFRQKYYHRSEFTYNAPDDLKARCKAAVMPYRYSEAMKHQQIFCCEGESTADALWALGIPAITTIGGSDGLAKYGKYAGLLDGKDLVICPDMDQSGLKYAAAVAELYPDSKWLYAFPKDPRWKNPPKTGGLDALDWIQDGATKVDILAAVEVRRVLKAEPKGSDQSITSAINQLLEQDLSDAELQEKQIKLCSEFGVSDRQLKSLWVKLEEERNFQETKGDRHQDLEKLLSIKSYNLSLKSILHKSLAEPFEKIAGWIGSSPEAFLTTLLPTVATLAWGGTELMLMPATGFRALPILYTGLVAESGSAKSPTQKMVTKPLFQLQKEEEEDYKKRLESWNDQCKKADENGEPKPDKPNIREFYTVDVTREAVALIQSQQEDRGFLCNHDELSGLFSGQNAYRGGKGGDKEALLSARDGSGLKVNRASGKRISTSGSYHSITGGTQPDTLKKMMGDFDDGSGQWARFMWCLIFQKPARYISLEEAGSTIDEMQSRLYSVYSLVQTYSPKTYTLSPEAENLYAAWFNQLDDLRLKEERQAFRAIYSKAKGNTGEMALILHLTNSAAARLRTPADMVSAQTMKAAISLMKFYIGQVKLVHSLGDEQRGEVTPVLAKIIEFSKRKGEVSARECKAGIAALRNEDVAKIRGYFRDLVEGDYGVLTGSGDRVRFQVTVDKSKTVDKKLSTVSTVDSASDTAITDDTTVDNLSTPSTPDTEPLLEEISETVDDFPLSDKSGGFNKGDRVPLIGVGDKITITEGEYQDTYPIVTEVIEDSGQTFYRVAEKYGADGQPDPADFEAVIHSSHCKKYSIWDRRSPFASPKSNTYALGSEATILDIASPYKGRVGEVRELITSPSGETLYRVVRDYEGTPELNFDATFPLQSIRALAVRNYTWEPA
jgi:hypothetical protein